MPPASLRKITDYTKLFWANTGNHNSYTAQKFLPEFTYEELEPYYTLLEYEIGIAGDDAAAFLPRSKGFPMPPMRPFRMGELFKEATKKLDLQAHPVPVGVNTVPYRGRPATTYCAWSNGFGSYSGDKWDLSLSRN